MKIGIDLRHLRLSASGGVPLQVKGACEAMIRAHPEHEYYIFCTIFNRQLIQSAAEGIHFFSLPVVSYAVEMEAILREAGVEILFRGFPSLDPFAYPMSRQVTLIPDLQHDFFPDFFPPEVLQERRAAFNRVMTYGGGIATNTEYTRETILNHPANRCRDIFLMPPALHLAELSVEESQLRAEELVQLPQKPFFYYPANLWKHKNHHRLCEAFARFLEESSADMELIFTGHPDGWLALQAGFPGLPIRHLGFVRPVVVRHLYQHAAALVFFSLYEGFGQPLLEAFALDTPVLCSNTTALVEVGGQAVLGCDPTDVAAMANLMGRIIRETGLRQSLVSRGRERLQHFTWEGSAENLHLACLRVAEHANQPRPLEDLPLVSIVTPSFNQGRFLRRTIESVLSQDYPRIEYIVIDGDSTDESLEILESFGDRLQWVSEKDNGQTEAINKGFARSHGEIRAYLNSDDVLLPGAVKQIVDIFLDYPEYDLVYGKAYYIDENDQVTGEYRTAEYSLERLIRDNCICQPATFWRTGVAQRCGPFNEQLHFSMDFEYWLRLARMGARLVFIPEHLACSRLYAETKTLSHREKIYQETFQVSQAQGGYVDLSYFQGYWYHRWWEINTPVTRLLRAVPGLYKLVTQFHYAWFNRRYILRKALVRPLREFLRDGLRTSRRWLLHQLKTNLDFVRPVVRRLRGMSYQVDANKPVFGVWPDNWLGPIAQFYIQRKNLGETLYLHCIPAQDLQVQIKIEQQNYHLPGNKANRLVAGQEVRLELPLEIGQRMQIQCTPPWRDANGRYLALRITSTNLFAEYDPLA
jgi:glycosyltransferase involved in cell wall biosynthesis